MAGVTVWQDMASSLEAAAAAGLLRRPPVVESPCGPRVRVGGRDMVCLCSNDYLSLAADAAVTAAAARAVGRWGVGAGASRLVSGTTTAHRDLERRLAAFKGAEDVVVTSTGWMANRVAVCALAGRGDLVLCDKLDHASILDAARGCGATVRVYPHRNVARAAALLRRLRARHRRCALVTDSLFSMDGDVAPLAALADLKDAHDAVLVIDEAHATGVMGAAGRGVAELLGVEHRVDVTVGTLSKALGAMGGFVAGPKVLTDTLRNSGRAYVYTTALPPAVCVAAATALELVQRQPQRRRRLRQLAQTFRADLRAAGLDTGDSASQIVPVVIGGAQAAAAVSARLADEGFLIPAIRPPSVPRGTSRLRCSLTAAHDPADLSRLVGLLADLVGARRE
jgi:8-amino-7-oxononanoate synthase